MKIFTTRPTTATPLTMVASIALIVGLVFTGAHTTASRADAQEKNSTFSIVKIGAYSIQNSAVNLTVSAQHADTIFTVAVLAPTNTRSELFDFADNLGKRRVVHSVEIPLSQFIASTTIPGQYSVDIPVNSDGSTSLIFGASGVYPLAISSRLGSGSTTDTQYSFITNIPTVAGSGLAYSQRLTIVPLLEFSPFIDRPGLVSNNKLSKYGTEIRDDFAQARNTMASIAAIGAPASVLLSPETLDTYFSISNISTKDVDLPLYPATSTSLEYLNDTYTPINIAELQKQDMSRKYTDLLATGRSVVTREGYVAPARTLATQMITPESIEMIARSGIDNVIVDDTTFHRDMRPSLKPTTVEKNSSTLKIGIADTSINAHIPSSLSDSAKASYLLAATSVFALESPSIARGLILPMDLSRLSQSTLEQFFQSTLNNPLIATTTSKDFFSQLNPDKTASKKLSKASYPQDVDETFTREQFTEISLFTQATESMFANDAPQTNAAQWMKRVVYSRSDRKVDKIINTASARALAASVESYIALPEKRTLTITSRENKIPVTIRNTSGSPISVTIHLESDKLAFPKGSSFRTVLTQENTTVRIPVKARTSGSFPISITIISPEGNVVVGEQSATVRSTVVSGAGVTIAIASALFLALWWGSHFRRSRKKPLAPVIELAHENVG